MASARTRAHAAAARSCRAASGRSSDGSAICRTAGERPTSSRSSAGSSSCAARPRPASRSRRRERSRSRSSSVRGSRRLATQVEVGRTSPLTYNKYEGDWRNDLRPAFGRLPLGANPQLVIVSYMNRKLATKLTEATVKNSLVPLCGMPTNAVAHGHIANNPLRSPTQARHRGGGRHNVLDLQISARRRSTSRSARGFACSTRSRSSTST